MPNKKYKISTPSLLAVDESFSDDRFMKVRIDVLESDTEARGHGFRMSRECLENSKDSFANIPILANMVTKKDKDGNEILDYGGHDFYIEDNKFKDGETKVIYEERPVGVVPETCNAEIKDNELGHAVLSLDAYIYRDYGNYCLEILENREGKTSVSIEMDISDVAYVEEDSINEVGNIFPWGITLLGEDVEPALANAKAEMLSLNEDSRQRQLMSIMQELKTSLDNYTKAVLTAKETGKEESDTMKFKELLAKYNLKEEDVTFNHENMSDEELEKAFEELSSKFKSGEPKNNPEPKEKNVVELSITMNDKTINLSRSLSDVIYAIQDLVNTTYVADGDYYYCSVYDDGTAKSKYVIMSQAYGGHSYKQTWSIKDGSYTLKGDREEVFSEWMTAAERDQLNSMRTNYSALSAEVDGYKEKLEKFESEPDKMTILRADEYSQIAETEEYCALLSNHFDVSKEELTSKLDSILLSYVKSHSKENRSNLSAGNSSTPGMKLFPNSGGNLTGRYGGMFKTP